MSPRMPWLRIPRKQTPYTSIFPYIKLNRGTRKAVGYFYHNTAECDFDMGREKSTIGITQPLPTDAGDIDLQFFTQAGCPPVVGAGRT